jgi:hypothetical protein
MSQTELIEVLFEKELQGLCINCAKYEKCSYRKNSIKVIIQCELYELADEECQSSAQQETDKLKGLCLNCFHADTCRLPDREFGVWHCEEYK